jgi:hypothetical protein
MFGFLESMFQDKGKVEQNTFLSIGNSSTSGTNQFVDTADETMKHGAKLWEGDTRYDTEVAYNVQVTPYIFLFVT